MLEAEVVGHIMAALAMVVQVDPGVVVQVDRLLFQDLD
jgi:hypothetical protein